MKELKLSRKMQSAPYTTYQKNMVRWNKQGQLFPLILIAALVAGYFTGMLSR